MGITIAIPTRNRAATLRQTLEDLRALSFDRTDDFEVIVIDNCSSDDTANVARAFASQWNGTFRLIYEEQLGLNFARNRAIAESQFDVVAFLDDDATVDPDWLRAMEAAHARDVCAAVGGRAHLVYPQDRPRWLGERDERYLTIVELGDEPRHALPDELYGVNLSINRQWAQHVGGFRTDVGRIGNGLMGGDELELLERLHRAGGRLWYEPAAVVGHRVDPSRLHRRWFWKRCYDGHRGDVLMTPAEQITTREIVRTAWHLMCAAGRTCTQLFRRGPLSEPLFHESLSVASKLGRLRGLISRFVHPSSVEQSQTSALDDSQNETGSVAA